jgi:hypothetical protein
MTLARKIKAGDFKSLPDDGSFDESRFGRVIEG